MEASGAPRCALADVLSVRLSRDDLEKWVNQLQAADDVACGCFVRVLLDGDADCRKYRMARIHSVSTIPNAYTFGNLTTTDKLLTLDFGHFSASYQMNTISNSPILQTELDDWLRSGKVSLGDFEAFLGRKQAQLAPLRAGGPARRSDTTMVDRLASDSSSRGTISRLATEMDQDTVEVLPCPSPPPPILLLPVVHLSTRERGGGEGRGVFLANPWPFFRLLALYAKLGFPHCCKCTELRSPPFLQDPPLLWWHMSPVQLTQRWNAPSRS